MTLNITPTQPPLSNTPKLFRGVHLEIIEQTVYDSIAKIKGQIKISGNMKIDSLLDWKEKNILAELIQEETGFIIVYGAVRQALDYDGFTVNGLINFLQKRLN